MIEIKIFEKFDNSDFGIESIEFLLSNDSINIKKAILKVRTTLYGVRWYMQEWLFTSMIIVVVTVTSLISSGVLVFVLILKRAGWLMFI